MITKPYMMITVNYERMHQIQVFMKPIKLTNINLVKRQVINGEDYFIIFDKNNENTAYFCFQNKLKND
jgi:hypothetical protein